MAKKNIFIVGLDPFNLKLLDNLPHAEACDFHAALDISDIRNVATFDMAALIKKAVDTMTSFNGTIDGVATYYDFPATDIVPILAEHFHLPGPSLESVLKCENKYWSRLEQQKVIPDHIPQFQAFDPFDDDAFNKIDILPPFWIKPVKAFKSFLAYEINGALQFMEVMKEVRAHIDFIGEPFQYLMEHYEMPREIADMKEKCIVESPIGGFQCTLEGYTFNGQVVGYGIVDSIRRENSSSFSRYEYPSSLPLEIQHRIIDVARSAIVQIGLDNSPFNIEFFYDQTTDSVFLLEINPRISQAHTDIFEKIHGYSHHHIMLDLALGRKPSVMEKKGRYSLASQFMVRTFETGRVISVPDEQSIKAVQKMFPDTKVKILVKEGQNLEELQMQDSYSYEIANLFVGGRDQVELLGKYSKIMDILNFRIEKEAPIEEI